MKIFNTLCGILLAVNFYAQTSKAHFDNKGYVEGEFLVQLDANTDIRGILKQLPADWNPQLAKCLSEPMRVWLVTFDPSSVAHNKFQSVLYSIQGVTVADYNYFVQVRSTVPDDVSFDDQWHHVNTGQTGGTNDADIDSDEAWDITTGGTSATGDDIVVCLVEGGGGNLAHQDLNSNRWINAGEIPDNSIDDDGNGYVDDYFGWNTGSDNDDTGTGGHGTNCLGMIGAEGNNTTNVVGANWNVKLMVVNMGGSLTQANVVEAYTYPLVLRKRWNQTDGAEGAFVVATSASWGIDGADPTDYPLWCQFYDTLGYYGVLNVGATTNSNLDVDTAGDMPTACASPYMIGVGRTDHNDNTAGGYGDETIEFGAPGINVVTTNGTTGITTTTGTSFACPLTAGVIGLAYSIPCADFMNIVKSNPQLGADLVLDALLTGTDPKTALASKFVTGGRLNSKNTLDNLMAAACSGNVCISPGSINTSSVDESTATISWTTFSEADESVLYFREVGAPTWEEFSSLGSSHVLSELNACTEYEYYLESVCDLDTSTVSNTYTFRTMGCGNCSDLSYCASSAGAEDEWIGSFAVGTYVNNSGSDGGYGDFYEGGSIDLMIGATYPITVTPDWSGSTYSEYSRIWIDFDQSGTFETGELVYDQGSATTSPATGTIEIPETALTGQARMRVQMAYQGSGQSTLPDVCGSFTWGEIEDYCVNLYTSGVGINEKDIESKIAIYPNPANESLFIDLNNENASLAVLYTLDGKVISEHPLKNGILNTVDLVNSANGFYIVRLFNNKELVKTHKLLIAK